MNPNANVLPLSKITELKKKLLGKKIVLVGGCFDIFHFGHLHFLREAKKMGDVLVVLLESDAYISRGKRKKPVHTQEQRAEILSSLRMVDYVVLLPELKHPDAEYERIVSVIRPTMIPITKEDPLYEKKVQLAVKWGAGSLEIHHLSSFSSSHIVQYASILRD